MKKLTYLLFLIFLSACSPELLTGGTATPSNNVPGLTTTPFEVMLPNVQSAKPTPAGAPLTEWQTIPIMPGALAGEETDGVYTFITPASIAEIKAYYLEQLTNAGYVRLSEGEAPNHLSIVFEKDSAQVRLTIDFLTDQNKSSVTIER